MHIERLYFRDLTPGAEQAMPVRMSPMRKGSLREEEPPAPPPPPSFSEEELKAAEREAYKRGFEEGEKEGRHAAHNAQAQVNEEIQERLETFTGFVSPILSDYTALIQEHRETLPKIALAIARKVADDALREAHQETIIALAARCLAMVGDQPKLSVHVHPALADALQEQMSAITAKLHVSGEVKVVVNEQCARSDVRIVWDRGFMERTSAQLWAQIEETVAGAAQAAPRDTSAQVDALRARLPEILAKPSPTT